MQYLQAFFAFNYWLLIIMFILVIVTAVVVLLFFTNKQSERGVMMMIIFVVAYLFYIQDHMISGACPSMQRVKGSKHPGQDTNLSRG